MTPGRRVAVRTLDVAWAMPAVHSAAGRWHERRGIVIAVDLDREGNRDGVTGLGEASPLPGMSHDDLPRCRAALADAGAVRWPLDVADDRLADAVIDAVEARCAGGPAAAWALSCALLDAAARARRCSMRTLWWPGAAAQPPALAALCDGPAAAAAAVARGVRTVKIKIGVGERADIAGAVAAVRAVREAVGPDVAIRADANRAFALGEVPTLLAALAAFDLEYVEEPAAGLGPTLAARLAVPVALDESAAEPGAEAWLDAALASGAVAALVLKPTLLGPRRLRALVARAAHAQVATVVTHALEGPIATAAAAELALALAADAAAPTRAAGLAPHAALIAWDLAIPTIGATALHDVARVGTGVDVARALAAAARLEPPA